MLLELKNISKSYGDLLANDNLSLHLNKGEVLAIVGENGAGKTTLMKVLYGLVEKDAGKIFINDQEVEINNPRDAINYGIGMVQQRFMLFDDFTVAENIVYGHEPKTKFGFFDRKKAVEIVEALSKKYHLAIDPEAKAGACPVGLQQRIEILKVLYQDAEIIIFDEPTAVLTPQEVKALLETIRTLADLGKSIILITHKLNEVMEVSDRLYVMREGKFVKEAKTKDISLDEIAYLMVGRELVPSSISGSNFGENILEIKDLVLESHDEQKLLNEINLNIRSGEIVGIAGVSGNGQSELIQVLTGIRPADTGEIYLDDQDIFNKSVLEIRKAGCATIPEDRYVWGSASEANLVETSIMGHYHKDRFSKHKILNRKASREFTKNLINKYDVRANSFAQKAGELSGGNLQKLILAREIEQKSKLLIAAEPSRGVDIGAIEFIHKELINKRQAGDAILLISSELDELLKLSDRIYTIYNGEINAEFAREHFDKEEIGLMMMGGKAHAKSTQTAS